MSTRGKLHFVHPQTSSPSRKDDQQSSAHFALQRRHRLDPFASGLWPRHCQRSPNSGQVQGSSDEYQLQRATEKVGTLLARTWLVQYWSHSPFAAFVGWSGSKGRNQIPRRPTRQEHSGARPQVVGPTGTNDAIQGVRLNPGPLSLGPRENV